MYNDKLSNIFNILREREYDKNGYPWGFNVKKTPNSQSKKVFYAIGDSWLDSIYFNRVFLNDYSDYFFINRSISGMSNAIMLDLIKKDMELLTSLDTDPIFLVAFSEVGRSIIDFTSCDPREYSSSHAYFGEVLKNHYDEIKNVIGDYPNYITTAFISNNFNNNLSIIDFCSGSRLRKPENVFSVCSTGIFDYLKDRNKIFKFNLLDDIEASLKLRKFMESHRDIDDTLHVNYYKVYEDFLENVFSNLNMK